VLSYLKYIEKTYVKYDCVAQLIEAKGKGGDKVSLFTEEIIVGCR
jgi:hypothetical protein